ncbi:L,D-transpeptidase [Oryzicola mucosus]|uniref:L,D-transpeptidase n=1 Tax=Oryzicola mucosus TaxID=2767425 RepID=A0A8J6PE87_9HYPH|nr:L,D-transpeptidase [Oryzicola mucosus]MBD0413059.1 L,D-transpeptidase [Oryzicola mucosus]
MTKTLVLVATAALAGLAFPAFARDRYAEPPPVQVSPHLSASRLLQLSRKPGQHVSRHSAGVTLVARPAKTAVVRAPEPGQARSEMNPIYLPQPVAYDGGEPAGTIIIDTRENFLYLVEGDGLARRYGVGTGKPGFEWAGTHTVTRKAEWPDWRPPSEMISRERARGRVLPAHVPGGPDNPLGARALYLGSTLYRIHGTNQPWTIGGAVSSGCIRMRNEDVVELYERVPVGARVVVR